ncbi:MAG: hypothetical protein J5379_00355 [Clostridiales bacterium]|nr:hypothetical protein [Clostridiales bacterium]
MKRGSMMIRACAVAAFLAVAIGIAFFSMFSPHIPLKAIPVKKQEKTKLAIAGQANQATPETVLFTTEMDNYGGAVSEYKLTLIDTDLNRFVSSMEELTMEGTTVSIPLDSSVSELSCISVLITDKPYRDGSARILDYSVTASEDSNELPRVSFILPSSLNVNFWGIDFHVYLVAENRYYGSKSDYASEPQEVFMPKADITQVESVLGGVELHWSRMNNYRRFNIYRADSADGEYVYLASVVDRTNSFLDTTADSGKCYYYKIRPYIKADGRTTYAGWSDASAITVQSVLSLLAIPGNGLTMDLSWTAVDGAQSYEIYRSMEPAGPYTLLDTTTACSITDTDLVEGTRYYYKVRAVISENGAARYSKEAYATAVALETPSIESIRYSPEGGVTIFWTEVENADRYKVLRVNGNKYEHVASVSADTLTFTDPNGKPGSVYIVCAYKKIGGARYYGGLSNPAAVG